jgi:Uma2 family endonuclease
MAAHAAPLVSVEEYLRSDYEPDRDYVDGELVERHLGEREHGETEFAICAYFKGEGKRPGLYAYLETRMRVSPTRYRVPDVCIYLGPKPTDRVFSKAPAVVIEVLSPEDRLQRMRQRVDDYLNFGVNTVWLVDPIARRGWVWDRAGMREQADGVLHDADLNVTLPLPEIFASIDAD